jgi:anthranilate phosphoribosyltransferase
MGEATRIVAGCRLGRAMDKSMDQAVSGRAASVARFAGFVATLGRGPGRSRALTRAEAREAMGLVLAGQADPHQVGAFLMLLRYRGEDPEEIAGLVEAAREAAALPEEGFSADLDWPSYGSGRTRGAPWFLLAALALARAGVRVLMHGSNSFSGGIPVEQALPALGLVAASGVADARAKLAAEHFAYLPLRAFAPGLDALLELRKLFGLRSPVNTVARLLDPARAGAGVDGVFHPPYIAVHLGVAELLSRQRLLVVKGAGGEAERTPAKPSTAYLWDGTARREFLLPAVELPPVDPALETLDAFSAVWRGDAAPARALATIRATLALALLAIGRADDAARAEAEAETIWRAR